MGRPQAFDRNDLLDKAMQVFWDKGYDAASIQDLVEATGVNRGSIYHAFGDKARLFEAVIEHYLADSAVRRIIATAETASPRAEIEGLFRQAVEAGVTVNAHRGCLMVNSAGEGRTRKVADKVSLNSHLLEDALTRLVERGQGNGQIVRWRDARAMGRFLNACILGMSTRARIDPDRDVLQSIADMAISTLD